MGYKRLGHRPQTHPTQSVGFVFVSFVFFVVNSSVVQRRFGLSGLLLAAWMTLIPSVGFAQDCLQWAERTPLGTARPLTGVLSAQRLATNEETE
mgnify:CR=1 FL=1